MVLNVPIYNINDTMSTMYNLPNGYLPPIEVVGVFSVVDLPQFTSNTLFRLVVFTGDIVVVRCVVIVLTTSPVKV